MTTFPNPFPPFAGGSPHGTGDRGAAASSVAAAPRDSASAVLAAGGTSPGLVGSDAGPGRFSWLPVFIALAWSFGPLCTVAGVLVLWWLL